MDLHATATVLDARLTGARLVGLTASGPAAVAGLTLTGRAEGLGVVDAAGRLRRCWPWDQVITLETRRAGGAGGVAGTVRVEPDAPAGDPGTPDRHRGASGGGDTDAVLDVQLRDRHLVFLAPASATAAFLDVLGRAGVPVARIAAPAARPPAPAGTPVPAGAPGPTTTRSRRGAHRRTPSWLRRARRPRRHRARHARRLWPAVRDRRAAPATALLCAAGVALGGSLGTISGASPGRAAHHGAGIRPTAGLVGTFGGGPSQPLDLPPATSPPAPAPPALADAPALAAHEIVAFAPYWALPSSGSFDVGDLTTLAYFSVDVQADGTIDHSGPGWVGYQSQALADLITRAHGAGDRVVLTATCFDQPTLDRLTADPTAAGRLASSLVELVRAKNLDGVNIDFEGAGPGDRVGLDHLVATVSAAVHGANPHWQVTVDTYASSAGDPASFYDIAGLAPSVDAFFVMAYDMDDPSVPTPTAALTGPGFTDLAAVQEYTAVVPGSKVILGVPFYGYDWPTAGPGLGDPATGPPTPVTDAQIEAAGHPVYWDPVTQTPWTSYQVGGQWHQTWFDDAASLSLKAQLAGRFHLRGVGVWALGMDGGDPTLLAALVGRGPVVKDGQLGPGPTATTSPPPTTTVPPPPGGYHYAGLWEGTTVTLTPVDPAHLSGGVGPESGVLTGFTTDDPAVMCLEDSAPLAVAPVLGRPSTFLVTATAPVDCASGSWLFTATGTTAPPPPTTSTTSASPTPTTTAPPPTSTTTTTVAAPTTTTTEPATPQPSPSTTTTTAGSPTAGG